MSPSRNVSLMLLHLIVVIFGFTGILGKLVSIQSDHLVFLRMSIAFMCLLPIVLFSGNWSLKERKPLWISAGVGLIIAMHWITFFEAINQSNVTVTLSTMAATSLFVALLSPIFGRGKIKTYEVFLGVLVILGLALIFGFAAEYFAGIVLALCSAALAAVFTLMNANLIRQTNAQMITLTEMGTGALAVMAYLSMSGFDMSSVIDLSGLDWLWVLLLAVFATAFAFVVSVEIMRILSPFTVAITVNLEPVYSIILALLIFGEEEKMDVGFYIGAAIIVGSIFLNSWISKKRVTKKAAQGGLS